jgi:hypothetical protein
MTRMTLERLHFTAARPAPLQVKHGCRRFVFSTWNKYLFLTSTQLISIFGLRLGGNVCADDVTCIKQEILRRWPKGSGYFVGSSQLIL